MNNEPLDTGSSDIFSRGPVLDERELFEQLNELSQRLRKAEQFKSGFLSNVRNEMINPLTSILGLTRLLLEEENTLPAQLRNTTLLLYREAFQLDFQIRNLLTAAEVEAGVVAPELTNVNIRAVMDAVQDTFKHRVKEKSIVIHVLANPQTDFHISTDAHLLHLILTNLLANAIGFSAPQSEVAITLTRDETFVQISFCDFGPGIPEDEIQWIFDRFQQVDMSSTKKYRGQGLGLSVVKALTEILQGTIHVENASPGSIFTVSVPVRYAEAPFPDGEWNESLFGGDQEV